MRIVITACGVAFAAFLPGCEPNSSDNITMPTTMAPPPPVPAVPPDDAPPAAADQPAAAPAPAAPAAAAPAAAAPGAAAPGAGAPAAGNGADENSEKAAVGVGAKGRDYGGPGFVTTPIETMFRAEERIAFEAQIPNAMKLYKAEHNNKGPKTHEEFMNVIIKENAVPLPDLPAGDSYWYDPKTEQLMVRHPTEKKS